MKRKNTKELNGLFVIVFTVFLLLILFSPQLVKKVVVGQQTLAKEIGYDGKCIGGKCNEVLKAQGYQVTLIKYPGPKSKGDPVQVGKPILIYNPDLLEEVTIKYEGIIPTSYDALESTNLGFSQIVNPPDEHGHQDNEDFYEVPGVYDGQFGGLFENANTFEQDINRVVDYNGNQWEYKLYDRIYFTREYKDYTCKITTMAGKYSVYEKYHNITYDEYMNIINSEDEDKDNGFRIDSQKFLTKNKTITYKGGKNSKYIDLSAYYNSYEEPLTDANPIGDLEMLLSTKYLKDINAIQTYFGVYIDPSEIDEFYVQVEPVQRVFLSKEDNSSLYFIKTLETKKGSKRYVETDFWVLPEFKYIDGMIKVDSENKDFSTNSWKVSYDKSKVKDCDCDTTYYCSSEGFTYDKKTKKCKNADGEEEERKSKRTCKSRCIDKNELTFYLKYTFCGKKQRFHLYGKIANGYSTVVTSRSLIEKGKTSSYYLNRAVNYKENNRHCELDKDNNCTGVYQNYIGPSLEKGLVGNSSTNYYKFGDEGGPTGIKHYYLLDPDPPIPIRIECSNNCQSHNKTSDEFLKCAENYCDAQVDYDLKGNQVKRKRECILGCGYEYETTGCNKNPYKNEAKPPLEKSSSTCNISGGSKMQDVKGTLVTCDGDIYTGDDDKDTIFDQRKYISVACKETTSFEYKDVNRETVFAGKGIDYFVNQEGIKECTYYFNTTQWKFDYASIPSKDLLRRQRLKYVYTTFNHADDKNYNPKENEFHYPTNNPYAPKVESGLDFANEHYGEIEVQTYDLDKTLVTSGVTEIVENKQKQSGLQTLVRKDEKQVTTLSNTGTDTLVLIANYSYNTASVSKYVSTSTATASYKYKKACIKTDGTSEVYYPGESVDTCHTIRQGANYKDVLAKNVYYTNLKATPNKYITNSSFAHYFTTTANYDTYYKNDETCEYKIGDSAVGCVVDILPESGTEKLGYNVFKGGNVKAKVIITKNDLPKDDDIASISIKVNNVDKGNVEEIVIGKTKAYEAKEDFKVEATITTDKDIEYTALCENRFSLLKDENGCTCVKKDDKLYEIIPNTTPQEVSASTLINMKPQKVNKSLFDSRYYVALEEPLEYGNTIIGYVKTGSGTASCSCPTTDVLKSCTDEFKPAELGSITEYCYANYDKDINNYSSAADCISRCSNNCPNDQRNEAVIDKFCTDNAINLGYDSVNECKNNCYNPYAEDGYLFRSIHNYDPFPYSPNSPYVQGNRGIGKNWYAKEEYIKDDDNDETSVTGDHANRQVEYIMDLDINVIRSIRKQNDKDGREAYSKLIYSSTTEDENYVGEYKSKLLNDTFPEIFKNDINGSIKAKYVPG